MTALYDQDYEHTGVTARWCPACGDCTCPEDARDLDTPGCPLHDPLDRGHPGDQP